MIHQMQVFAVILFCICLLGCQTKNQSSITENRHQNLEIVDTGDLTNNFFDNVEINDLPVSEIRIDGEVENPGLIKVNELPMRSVIVKETRIDNDKNSFVGAYKYEGYSLKDILNRSKIKKRNLDEFNPVIDLFVIVSNSYGEKAVFSWGELFNRNDQAEVLLINRGVNQTNGKFSIFPAADFFSDRAIKAIDGIYFDIIDD